MKNIIYMIMACATISSCAAQKNTGRKVYAYRQAVLQGGGANRVADETGKQVEQKPRAHHVNYHIYIESPDANTQVKTIWIKQVPYQATLEPAKTPVLMTSTILTNASPDTLVKASSAKVFRVAQGAQANLKKPGGAAGRTISKNELVVQCVVNGKEYYYALPVIKNLPPLALQ